jgi:hypothetical protein
MKMKWFIKDLLQAPINGYWYLVADILWGYSLNHREAYYAYKQDSWRNAKQAQTFRRWVRKGGWKLHGE